MPGWLRHFLSRSLLTGVHLVSRVLWPVKTEWVGGGPKPWREITRDLRLIVFLNHTSLFEPIFIGGIPLHFLWWVSPRLLVPGADKTMQRPVVGTFYHLLTPATVPISRKRDGTWEHFLAQISPQTTVLLAAEGRMKRRNGLDSKGEPMSVRGGVADILNAIPDGQMMLCYSGGLHHIQAPGEKFPRIFQTAQIRYEPVDIARYKKEMGQKGLPFKMAVVQDLEARMKLHCPR